MQVAQGSSFLPGIKQRLLSFIFRKTWNEEPDQALVSYLSYILFIHFPLTCELCGHCILDHGFVFRLFSLFCIVKEMYISCVYYP